MKNIGGIYKITFSGEIVLPRRLYFCAIIISLTTQLKFLLLFKITKAFCVMKKQSQKKLTLGKITVASLTKADQQMVKGGLPIDFTKRSVCAEACCPSDVNAQCRTL